MTVSAFMWRMAGLLVAAMIGLAMLFWALERTTLVALADDAGAARPPFTVYLTMFLGLVVTGFAVLFAVVRWSRYLGEHPDTKQLPLWFALALLVLAGGALVAGIALHAAWMNGQDPAPTLVNDGIILFEVLMGTLALVPLVLVSVRWAPGYARRTSEA